MKFTYLYPGPLMRERSGNAIAFLTVKSTKQLGVAQYVHTFCRISSNLMPADSDLNQTLPTTALQVLDKAIIFHF